MESEDTDFEIVESDETKLCLKIIQGDKTSVAEVLKVLEKARIGLTTGPEEQKSLQSRMLVALALFEMANLRERDLGRAEEALLLAYKLDPSNSELLNVMDEIGCDNQEELHQCIVTWGKNQDHEDAFFQSLSTKLSPNHRNPLLEAKNEGETEEPEIEIEIEPTKEEIEATLLAFIKEVRKKE